MAFAAAHELGMATVLWCYLRNSAFSPKDGGPDYHLAADLTSQANHLGVTIEADIIKQKAPETAAPGFLDLKFGKTDKRVYSELLTDHPIDMTRYQVAGCYMGRAGLINSRRGVRRERPARRRLHRGRQQARRRHGHDQRPQGVPAADGRGRRAAQRDPGRLPLGRDHHRLNHSFSETQQFFTKRVYRRTNKVTNGHTHTLQ